MAGAVEFNLSAVNEFIQRLRQAAQGDFKNELELLIHSLGTDFLAVVEDEIKRRGVMVTRNLLASFHEGGEGNVWEISDGGLTLEVGTNVKYAAYVNDGHWLNPKGVETRFVPGYWSGGRFVYDPNAKTGMVLKQRWIEGSHYFDGAVRIFEKMFPDILEAKLQKWLEKYFGGII
jgi:hypothetical protein